MIKLHKIEPMEILRAVALRDGMWMLLAPYRVRLHTSEGVIEASMKAGWITDFRSGSGAVDAIVPKTGNDHYNAIVLCHDLFYSGWLTRGLADSLLDQGMRLAGIASWRVKLATLAVGLFGGIGYYYLTAPMKDPYQHNRSFEAIKWGAK